LFVRNAGNSTDITDTVIFAHVDTSIIFLEKKLFPIYREVSLFGNGQSLSEMNLFLKSQLTLSILAAQYQGIGILKIYTSARYGGCMNMKILWVNAMMSGQEPDENEKSLQYPPF